MLVHLLQSNCGEQVGLMVSGIITCRRSLVGGVAQVGEAGAIGLTSIWPNIPSAFVDGSGRLLMVIATLLIIGPLCLVRGLRQVSTAT